MKKLIFTLSVMLSFQALADYVVVVNAANKAAVSMDDVKKIYMGKVASFSDGSSALPIMLNEGNETRDLFSTKVLEKSDSQYIAHWAKMLFTGNGTPPQEVPSFDKVKELVSKNPSTIGYVDESMVDASLKVIGKFN